MMDSESTGAFTARHSWWIRIKEKEPLVAAMHAAAVAKTIGKIDDILRLDAFLA